MLKEKIGMICVALSLSTLNMDFLIPFGFMATGLWLMRGFAE